MMTVGMTALTVAVALGASVLVQPETFTSRRTTAASGNHDRAETRRLFWGTRLWRWCVRCSARSGQREDLATLDDCFLDDIGVTRQQAAAEAAKPFWR